MAPQMKNLINSVVNEALDGVAPKNIVRISAKHRYIEPWMMKGLEKASNTKMKLYKTTLSPNHTPEDLNRYKVHRNLYNKLKPTTKETYYREKCLQFKPNSKTLWGVINETIKKVKHKGSIIPYITVDWIKQSNSKDIANSFGSLYSQLGATLVKKIVPGTTTINDYITKIPPST